MVFYDKDFYNDNERINSIIDIAKSDSQKFIDKKQEMVETYLLFTKKQIKFKAVYRNSKGGHYISMNTCYHTISDIAIENADIRNKYNFENNFEKMIYKMNAIFPDDEKFIDYLKRYDENNTLKKFANIIDYTDKIDDKQKKNFVKKSSISVYFSQNKNDIIEVAKNFKYYINPSAMEFVYNRLLQIKYLNPELYNQYINNEINKQKLLTK